MLSNCMNTENYGHELILDLHKCDTNTFTRQSIGEYFDELCELIGMQAKTVISGTTRVFHQNVARLTLRPLVSAPYNSS